MVIKERKYLTISDAIKIRKETETQEEFEERVKCLKVRGADRPDRPEGGITYSEAEGKYGINHGTIRRWVGQGYIDKLLETSKEVYINESQLKNVIEEFKKNPGQGRFTVRYMFGKKHPRAKDT